MLSCEEFPFGRLTDERRASHDLAHQARRLGSVRLGGIPKHYVGGFPMIRSACAALFAVVVATVLVTSPQSTEAKDRRCQPRCCPQTVCAQPQPACCQPRGTCCQPRPSCCHQNKSAGFLDVEVPYYCAYFQFGESGGVKRAERCGKAR